jgi:hypothetical protein
VSPLPGWEIGTDCHCWPFTIAGISLTGGRTISVAEMLGVRRTSVTEIAGKFQAQVLFSNSRSLITILWRKRLEELSCEFFQTLLDQSAKLPTIR